MGTNGTGNGQDPAYYTILETAIQCGIADRTVRRYMKILKVKPERVVSFTGWHSGITPDDMKRIRDLARERKKERGGQQSAPPSDHLPSTGTWPDPGTGQPPALVRREDMKEFAEILSAAVVRGLVQASHVGARIQVPPARSPFERGARVALALAAATTLGLACAVLLGLLGW